MVAPGRWEKRSPLAVLILTLALLLGVLALPTSGPAGTAQAASYSFSVTEERMNVTVLSDGSADIDYVFKFANVSYLDGVDVGLPNNYYSLSSASAEIIVAGMVFQPAQLRPSPYILVGVAVEFDGATISEISAQRSFTLLFHINNPHLVYRNDQAPGTVGLKVMPTWFSPSYQVGPTGLLNASILLPAGMTNLSEVVWLTGQPYNDLYFDNAKDRIVATWQATDVSPSAQAVGTYDIGAGFPAQYVSTYFDPSTDPNSGSNNSGGGGDIIQDVGNLLGLLFPLLFIAFFLTIMYVNIKGAYKGRSDYFEPKLSVVGAGPRRDLTAVEAAVTLETPLDKVATMILFGLTKKNKVRVLSETMPMRLERLSETGDYPYETTYLSAILNNGTLDRNTLKNCLIDLIRSTSKKVEGFDIEATKLYYRAIVEKAWKQVTDAQTPEEFSSVLQQQNDWMMLDRNYESRMAREIYPLPILLMPHNRHINGWPRSQSDQSQSNNLAQNYVDKVRGASNNLVNDMRSLTSQVIPFTNPLTATMTSGGGGFHGGGGGHCACACACACAGGGR